MLNNTINISYMRHETRIWPSKER